jgi:CheY-like chemotaxis protein
VVDDDDDLRDILGEVIRAEGLEVVLAEHGAAALRHLRDPSAAKPALILLDLMMPVLDGWQLLEAIAADEELRAIPIVVMSAFGLRARRTLPLEVPFVEKPVDIDDLIVLLQPFRAEGTS